METTEHIVRIDFDKLDKIFPQADFRFFDGCVEPRYDDKPVILADWNHVPNTVFDKLEHLGYSCEWSDEWIECNECYKVFRQSPDSYSWQMSGTILECEVYCLDCLKYHIDEYFESLENNPRTAMTWTIHDRYNPIDYGYELVKDEYENGWYPGQNANPQEILKSALELEPDGKFIFAMTAQGQFDVEFSFYRKIHSEN